VGGERRSGARHSPILSGGSSVTIQGCREEAATAGFAELSVGDLLASLGSARDAPGGGSAAAIVLAIAAAVVEMAARASGDEWEEAGGAVAQASALQLRCLALAERDAEAYDAAVAALRPSGEEALRSTGEPERSEISSAATERDDRLGAALAEAAVVPLQIAHAGADIASLAGVVAERADPDLRADALVAALLASAASRGAARLVEVNLATTGGDPRTALARQLADVAAAAVERALADG
jgi:formiminotetrahydrofolate cyclodeaminase